MATRNDPAVTLPSDAVNRRTALAELRQGDRGFDRGALSAQPLEDIAIGSDMLVAPVDVGHLPFKLQGLAFIAYDASLSSIRVGLYRVSKDDLLPGGWSAKLSGSRDQQLVADPYEYVVSTPQEKEIDRTAAAWLVAAVGLSATVFIRGTQSYGMPAFSGWSMPAPGGLPASIESSDLSFDRRTPAVGLLTVAGLRLRGTGSISA